MMFPLFERVVRETNLESDPVLLAHGGRLLAHVSRVTLLVHEPRDHNLKMHRISITTSRDKDVAGKTQEDTSDDIGQETVP